MAAEIKPTEPKLSEAEFESRRRASQAQAVAAEALELVKKVAGEVERLKARVAELEGKPAPRGAARTNGKIV